ncbi:hypothetical protein BDQ17DRAFT_1418221 [Cyathus striatus]|nr:hypothetical protein BDQ17DRAFT_1418221 [Cyathus striatus]
MSESSQSAAPIFINPDGSPLQIFVEAGGVNNRPALVRKLRKAGANICIDPKNAQIILVDDDTDQGRHFIRDWGRDENKVVLKHLWVEKCRGAGKVLTSQDEWGDCLTVDDGLPISTEEEDGEHPTGNPLPTPRETPVSSAHGALMHSQTPIISHSRTSSADISIAQVTRAHSGTPQQGPGFGAQKRPQKIIMAHLGIPSPYPPQDGMVQIPSQILAGLMKNPQFGTALADAVSFHARQMPSQLPAYNPVASYFSSFNETEQINASQPQYITEGGTDLYNLAPSISRDVSPSTEYKSLKSKGKRREISSSPARNSYVPQTTSSFSRSPAVTTVSRIFTHKNGFELSFYVQVELHNRKDVVSTIKKNGGRITSDIASADYVILQARGTDFLQLRSAAMEVGAPAITANFVFDCAKQVQLLNHKLYLHDNPKKRGRKASEVEDDSDEANSEKEREKKRLSKNERQREYAKKKKEEAVGKESKKVESMQPGGSSPQRRLSSNAQLESLVNREHSPPSPPPPVTKEFRPGSSTYKYSEHERNAISAALHKKMPHHTIKSWKSFVGRDMADQIDNLRRRASIAHRKALSHQQALEKEAKSRESSVAASTTTHTDSLTEPNTAQPIITTEYTAVQEEDLMAIARFFAFSGGDEDGQDDAEIWGQLKAQATCKSEKTWEEFWNKHSLEATRRYEALLNAQPTTPADGR